MQSAQNEFWALCICIARTRIRKESVRGFTYTSISASLAFDTMYDFRDGTSVPMSMSNT